MAPLVLQQEIHFLQFQLWRTALRIAPADPAVAHHDLPLRQQPVQPFAIVVRLRLDQHAADIEPAVGSALHFEVRTVDLQHIEPEVGDHKRFPGQGGGNLRQAQRRLAGTVMDHDIVEHQVRVQPMPGRMDGADGHRPRQRLARHLLDIRLVPVDVRQHQVAQTDHRCAENEVQHQQSGQHGAQQVMGKSVRSTINHPGAAPADAGMTAQALQEKWWTGHRNREQGTGNLGGRLQRAHVRMDDRALPTETANRPKIPGSFSHHFPATFTSRKPHLD